MPIDHVERYILLLTSKATVLSKELKLAARIPGKKQIGVRTERLYLREQKRSDHLQTLHLNYSKGTKLLQGARLAGTSFEDNKNYVNKQAINILDKTIYKVTKAAVLSKVDRNAEVMLNLITRQSVDIKTNGILQIHIQRGQKQSSY